MVTVPSTEPGPPPIAVAGDSVSDVGAGPGTTVIADCTVTPFQLAEMVTGVFVVTLLVGTLNEVEKLPGGTVTVDGGVAAGELLERLTTAPPAGAWPVSITIPPAFTPPLALVGVTESDFSAGGCTMNWTEAVPPLSVAVSVTGVGDTTCPACIWNCVQAMLPCIGIVDGTDAALGFELVMPMTAPLAGTAAVSCTATHVVSPLVSGSVASVIDTGVGGAELIVNVRGVDHAVTAAVVGEASPCVERTRQNFVPAVSDSTVREGPLSCGSSSSIDPKPESRAICSSYPLGCGLGTCAQVSVTGSVSAAPLAGDTSDGGGPIGLLKKTEKAMIFDGALTMPLAFTAKTRAE